MRRYEAVFRILIPDYERDANVFSNCNLTTDNLLESSAGEELQVAGDRLLLRCYSTDKEAAKNWAGNIAERFAQFVSLKTGQYIVPLFEGLDSVPGEPGQGILTPLTITLWVETYDRANLAEDLMVSGRACTVPDERLHSATTYFRRGIFYLRIVWRLVHPNLFESAFNVNEATLNFYLAVEVILGSDRQWRQRATAIGLDKHLKGRSKQLYERRSNRGVAHALLGPSALEEVKQTVHFSQDTAHQVIASYATFLFAGGKLGQ